MIEFDVSIATVVGLLASVGLPLIVGLVTKTVTHSGVKAVLLAALAAIAGLLTELASALGSGEVYNLGQALVLALFSFLVATGIHFGLYKPLGVSQRMQEITLTKDSN
jgi:hypothetical protein